MKKLLLSITIFATSLTYAQVIHTDVNPDVLLTATPSGEQFDVDFNSDAAIDVSIVAVSATVSGTPVYIQAASLALNDETALVSTITSGLATPTPLTLNTLIGPASAWVDTSTAGSNNYYLSAKTTSGSALAGTFHTGTDRYLGVRFLIGANLYYGWVLLNVASDASTTTVKAFAYESTPNVPIKAGSTTSLVGVSENLVSASVFPNPANDKLNVTAAEAIASVTVVTADGKVVASANGPSADVSGLSTGMYIYTVVTVSGKTANGTFAKN